MDSVKLCVHTIVGHGLERCAPVPRLLCAAHAVPVIRADDDVADGHSIVRGFRSVLSSSRRIRRAADFSLVNEALARWIHGVVGQGDRNIAHWLPFRADEYRQVKVATPGVGKVRRFPSTKRNAGILFPVRSPRRTLICWLFTAPTPWARFQKPWAVCL